MLTIKSRTDIHNQSLYVSHKKTEWTW